MCTRLSRWLLGETDGVDMEGSYSAEEVNELVNVMKKLIRVRDVVLKVKRTIHKLRPLRPMRIAPNLLSNFKVPIAT